MNWEVLFCVTPGGQPVIEKFVEGLDKVTRAKTLRQIDLLKIYGSDLGMPHSKALGGGLVELRVRGQREVRIFYVFAKGKQYLCCTGSSKKPKQLLKKSLILPVPASKRLKTFSTYMH